MDHMLIVCPNCATSYTIEPDAVGSSGRTVRCARCKATWFAGAPTSGPDAAAPVGHALADAALPQPSARAEELPFAAAAPESPPAQATTDDDEATAPEPIPATETELPQVGSPPAQPVPTVIGNAPPLVPEVEHGLSPETAAAELESDEAESFAARRLRLQARRKQTRRSSRWTAVILVLVAFNAALIGGRKDVVHYLPQTASLFAAIGLPVNLRHLKFENVRISNEAEDGGNVLIVEGAIVSNASKALEVPRLRFAARNASGQEIYTWTAPPSHSILGPGERQDFRSQIAAPPSDARDVTVRFLTAQDAGAK